VKISQKENEATLALSHEVPTSVKGTLIARFAALPGKWYLDEYDFRARLVPSIFVTLPAILALFALLPSLRSWGGFVLGP
jgi:hypothetical protein